jgi:hypothetical protein
MNLINNNHYRGMAVLNGWLDEAACAAEKNKKTDDWCITPAPA